ncbi:MAG: epoxyqueuosine reductase [Candidatus Saccharibacteria bacterium]
MIDSSSLKSLVLTMGADLCGIAPVDRFKDAPEGFRPTDIYRGCKSVLVVAKRVPYSSIYAESCIPYTHINRLITIGVDELVFQISGLLEQKGIRAVPVPSDEPLEYWEPENQYARGVLSMRHAGYLAGLGVLGKNTLLINDKLGNMIQIGAVLLNIDLEGDPLAEYEGCLPDCEICLQSCPQQALNGVTVNQKLCRLLSNYEIAKGYAIKKCSLCRTLCPNALGISEEREVEICG